MDDDDTIAFKITDYDLDNEFNPNRKKRKFTRDDAIYGVWNDKESEDEEEEGRVGLGGKGVSFVTSNENKDQDEEGGRRRQDQTLYHEESDGDDKYMGLGANKKNIRTDALGIETQSEFGRKEKPKPMAKPQKADRDFGAWEKHTKGIGMRLLEKMGYQKGQGIGREKEGRVNPVDAKLREVKKGGLGFGGDERTPQQRRDGPRVDEEEKEVEEITEKIKLWKKGISPESAAAATALTQPRKPKTNYTVGGLARVAAAQATANQTKVIDMTGPTARVLVGYEQISGHKKPSDGAIEETVVADDKSMPELQYNVRLLVEYAEGEIQSLDSKLAAENDALVVLGQECKKISESEALQREQVNRLEQVVEMLNDCNKRRMEGNPLSLDECVVVFARLQTEYQHEFEVFDLAYLAVALVFPLVNEHMLSWQPLVQPTYGLDLFTLWKDVLQHNPPPYSKDRQMDAYERLLWEIWLPKVRMALGSWDPRDHSKVYPLIAGWSKILPDWLLDNIIDQLIYSKISKSVDMWNPQTDTVPIHQWLHPWIPFMGTRMDQLYPLIRHKLMMALHLWQPADPSAHAILLPWKNVFSSTDMETLLTRAIMPKLQLVLQQLQINPAQQQMEPLHWVLAWVDLVPAHLMVPLFESQFFPKWSVVLVHWLNSSPNYDEVTNWYLGWKKALPSQLTSHGPIQSQFRWALDTMNQALAHSNMPIHLPTGGKLESTQYFADLAQRQANQVKLTAQRDKDRQSDNVAGPSFREILMQLAADHDIIFQPKKPARFHNGNPLYSFGKLTVYMERNVVFYLEGSQWLPLSLDGLAAKAMGKG